MKPKFFTLIVVLVAWGFLGVAHTAQAQVPGPSPFLSVKLSKAVSAVADPDGVEVHLWCAFDLNPWSAPGSPTTRDAWVAPVRCAQGEALVRGLRPRAGAKREFAQALVLLLRAGNMAVGISDLNVAECKAIQQTEFLAEELGASRKYARDLAVLGWKFSFRPEGCRPGGPLDFHLGRWPAAAYLPPSDLDGKG